MVQVNHRPPRRRFDDISQQQPVNELPRRKASQAPQQLRRHSHWRLFRYRLLIIKVRVKVFFIKAKRRPKLTGAVLMASLTLIIGLGIIIYPHKAQSQTELEYYQEQLDRVQSSVQIIKQQNKAVSDNLPLANQIEDYKNALVESLAACNKLDAQAEQTNKEQMKDYLNAINHGRQFCSDYEDVGDYAYKVSKATKQFIVQPLDNLTDQNTTSSINDLVEILGYTQTDLKKLKGNPLDDPALEEMIIGVENLQKTALTAQQSPTDINRRRLAEEAVKLKENLTTARLYFWTNTIKVDALDRSITRVRNEFAAKD